MVFISSLAFFGMADRFRFSILSIRYCLEFWISGFGFDASGFAALRVRDSLRGTFSKQKTRYSQIEEESADGHPGNDRNVAYHGR